MHSSRVSDYQLDHKYGRHDTSLTHYMILHFPDKLFLNYLHCTRGQCITLLLTALTASCQILNLLVCRTFSKMYVTVASGL